MIAPETLLKMHPLDALRAMIGENLKTPLKADYLLIGAPKAINARRTAVTVMVDKSRAPLALWDRIGTFDFTYDRIPLDSFTSGMNLTVKAALPASPTALLRNLFYKPQIPVVSGDLVEARYSSLGAADVIAHEESYRWTGEIVMQIGELAIEIPSLILVDHFTFSFDDQWRSINVKQRIATQLNLSNASSLPTLVQAGMFTLGVPEVNGPIEDGDNTAIELVFNGAPYIGGFKVFYARRAFQQSFYRPIKITANAASTSAWSSALSSALGCSIAALDIKDEPVPSIGAGQTTTVVVNFSETSLAYVGSILVNYTRSA